MCVCEKSVTREGLSPFLSSMLYRHSVNSINLGINYLDANQPIVALLLILLGLGCLLMFVRLFVAMRRQRRTEREGGAAESGLSAAADRGYERREKEWEVRWAERERQFERQSELQRSEQEKYYRVQIVRYQNRIEELESAHLSLQAEKVRLETILEQQSGLQNQLLEQSKLNWEEFSHKQQREQSQYILQNIQPLQQQLQYFQQKLEQQHNDGIKSTAQLEQYLKNLQEDTRRLNDDALNLAEALKGDQKRQGAWGEMILARTLEQSGLREGVEYQLQKSFVGADGQVFRPDAVVQFPGQRYIIIDSKVSLKAYEAFGAANDEAERQKQLKRHSESLNRHIKELAAKEYQKLLGMQRSPDFVLLFFPIEGALAEALRFDHALFEEGFRRHIVLVSPTLLFVVLRIVEQLWRYEKQRRNVAAVFAQAGKIFDKLAVFCGNMSKVEQQVASLHKTVEQAIQQLAGGRQSLLRQVQKLQDLGADTTKNLSTPWLESTVAGTGTLSQVSPVDCKQIEKRAEKQIEKLRETSGLADSPSLSSKRGPSS